MKRYDKLKSIKTDKLLIIELLEVPYLQNDNHSLYTKEF